MRKLFGTAILSLLLCGMVSAQSDRFDYWISVKRATDGKWGYKKVGKVPGDPKDRPDEPDWCIEPRFLYAGDFKQGECFATVLDENRRAGIIDRNGNFVLEPLFDNCIYQKHGGNTYFFHVKTGGKWGATDLEGNMIVDCIYDRPLQASGFADFSDKENLKIIFSGRIGSTNEIRDIEGEIIPGIGGDDAVDYVDQNYRKGMYRDKYLAIIGAAQRVYMSHGDESPLDSYPIYARAYVEKRINEWQKKGEYEKSSDWQKRVTEEARREKVREFVEQAGKNYLSAHAPGGSIKYELSLSEYDADNEVYLIKNAFHGDILVEVPLNEAREFRERWEEVTANASYTLDDSKIVLDRVEFTMPDGGPKYEYNNSASLNYNVAQLNYNFDPIDMDISSGGSTRRGQQNITTKTMTVGKSDVDVDIPECGTENKTAFAVIIANENYQRESPVEFAINDGQVFRQYCSRTLGLPENHIRYVPDATLNNIRAELNWLSGVAGTHDGQIDIIFYYAGHGIPDEKSGSAYLLPVDGYGSDPTTGYKVDDLYAALGSLKARSIVVFMDACFSGAKRGEGMLLSARGVAIRPKQGVPTGNVVVFASAQGDETAYPYRDKGHGLFTYFLLKKLQESSGTSTLGELAEYISSNVRRQSIIVNGKLQSPSALPSPTVGDWQTISLR